MESIQRLLEWATEKGVVIDGMGPRPLPGRGIGIVATRDLKKDEDILTVPVCLLRSLANTPAHVTRSLNGATTHAVLATSLCLETGAEFAIWRAVLPTRREIRTCMPLSWPPQLQNLLPPAARRLLDRQRAKFDRDWALASAAHPSLRRPDFLYAWLLVNSRTFYHTTPLTETLPREDHMVLQPVADLFNHSPLLGCRVAFDAACFTITTTHAHREGDELFIRYGAHSNDFLLVEYGFTLPGAANPCDEVCLDPYLCPLLSAQQREQLEEVGFWGKYMLDSETACYRTQIALRVLCLSDHRWRDVLDGVRDEDEDKAAAGRELLAVLARCQDDVGCKLRQLGRCEAGTEAMRGALRQRWLQINELVNSTTLRLQQ
ncbi:uncharacterized protein UV8b_04101 [Ustilaginoidea virens]|uniref:SET domain-containing protein n=1 Tax=Ustilaginoidea virens TaxID=1159556 RepID=A0A063C5V8_USTVR|nr:uncharacterized protein UV8b_04101 [Ustilaginoidea virens]QUC19860.1 hypothetical protein UV8b_04101 [Ustilaginoidea virens]GAO14862.1 hypothetical protein UVI_02005870 [Ustilaginoidea virens]